MSGIITTSGQTISGTIVSGETITDGTIPSLVYLTVLSGGEIIDTDVGGLDIIYIESGAVAMGTTFGAPFQGGLSDIYVYAGATMTDTLFLSENDTQYVDGGVASGSTFQNQGGGSGGGFQYVENGGIAYDTDLTGTNAENGFAYQIVSSGGTANVTTIAFDDSQVVYAGGTAMGAIVEASGTQNVSSGGNAIDTTVDAGGTMYLDGQGIGTTIEGGTEYTGSASTISGDTDFVGSGGTLELAGGTNFSGTTIFGFETIGNQIDLLGITYAPGGVASLHAHNLLTVTEGSITETIQLDPSHNFSGDTFHLAPLTGGGVKITLTPCFAAGTRILTPRGEVPVEALKIGDAVITASGDDAAIKWIGVRRLDLSRHPAPEKAQPIRFEADCFADGVPTRDLILSPDHALYVDRHLVPAKALINDRNIRQLNRPTVTYYHIELAEHSIIFAENAAVESYLETGNRGAFQNVTGALTLHPDFAQTMREQNGCAPFTETGPVVDAARMRALEQYYTLAAVDQRRHGSRS